MGPLPNQLGFGSETKSLLLGMTRTEGDGFVMVENAGQVDLEASAVDVDESNESVPEASAVRERRSELLVLFEYRIAFVAVEVLMDNGTLLFAFLFAVIAFASSLDLNL